MIFGEAPEHIRKRHAQDIPSLGSLDDIQLPAMAATYKVEVTEVVVPRDAVLDSSAKLDSLTEKALQLYDDVLSLPIASDDFKLLSAQLDAARTIMTTQLRVDDSRLKKRTTDTLAELLHRMNAEDAKLINA